MKPKIISITILFCLLKLTLPAQYFSHRWRPTCVDITELLNAAKLHFQNKFSLLDEPASDMVFLKERYKDEILKITNDSLVEKELLEFLNFKSEGIKLLLDSCKTNFDIVSGEIFKKATSRVNYSAKKSRRFKIRYPVLAITNPYLFDNGKFCLVGVEYFSGPFAGTFGYYQFEKKDGRWQFLKTLFELLA